MKHHLHGVGGAEPTGKGHAEFFLPIASRPHDLCTQSGEGVGGTQPDDVCTHGGGNHPQPFLTQHVGEGLFRGQERGGGPRFGA